MGLDRLKIIFAGSGEFGAPSLTALLDAGHELVQVFTQPDRPAGRGRSLTPTPIGSLAASRNLPLIKTSDINKENLPAADLLIVIAFGQKIAPHVVDHARHGSVNLHASILPKYRGAAPINWAIVRGETEAGNSIIRLAQMMDAGAVLAQSRFPIGELETAGELHDRLSADGAPLMLATLQSLNLGTAVETPQDESLATIAPKLTRSDALLDFNRPAGELARQIRGFYPWPGCMVELQDAGGKSHGRVTLVRARASAGEGSPAGVTTDEGVATGAGTALEIVEVKPEGKKPMTLRAFRNGNTWTGLKLVSKA